MTSGDRAAEAGDLTSPVPCEPNLDAAADRGPKWDLNPTVLAYVIGPIALVTVLLLMHFDLVAHESPWVWLALFVAVPGSSLIVDRVYSSDPSRLRLHLRVAVQAAGVTAVIYLSGWGPVLWGAYAFLALENIARGGSSVWRVTALWSLVGMATGQILISNDWAPSLLPIAKANTLAIMGAFVLFFIVRMAGATMEEKERAEDRFRSLIQNSSDTTMVVGADGVCTYVSPAITELLGYDPSEVVGRRTSELVHPDERERFKDHLTSQLRAHPASVLVQLRMQHKTSGWRDVEAVVANQLDRSSVAGYVANIRDITERKEFEALLAHRALHDPLTGLPNRQLILDRANQMLARGRRNLEPVALYFIDLDNFKDANDSLGHEAGDKLLKSVANRFVGMLRASDTVGRLGGDEFVILAEGLSLSAGPELVAERIREVLREPFVIDGFEGLPVTATASIGIATGDRDAAQDLLRDADIALYRAKAAGKDRSVVFEEAMQSAAIDRLELKSDLDAALPGGQFFLLYQPIFELEGMTVRGVEALLRWRHPTKGVISPDNFIPVLEDSGMIIDVGRWVLEQACSQTAQWQSKGFSTTVAVNVSMRQLESDILVEDVRRALSTSGLDPASLIIEVTESNLMRDANATVSRLNKLKEIGVMVAIDDFGTGYSSLAYLRQFPVDVLKIDRSFISEMDGSPDAAALIHTLVELGRTLGLVTLAEGIEDRHQLEGLRNEQCDRGQGFIFSRPIEPDKIEHLLARTQDIEADHPSPAHADSATG